MDIVSKIFKKVCLPTIAIGILLFCTFFVHSIVLFDNDEPSVLLGSRSSSQVGAFDFKMFEFDDIAGNTWVELKVDLNQTWIDDNGRDVKFRQDFLVYMQRVARLSNMVELESEVGSLGAVTSFTARVDRSVPNRFVAKNLKNTDYSFFKIRRNFEYINPFSQFWSIVQQKEAYEDANSAFSLLDSPLEKWAYIFANGLRFVVNDQSFFLNNIFDELNFEIADFKNSLATYYFSTNRNVNTKKHSSAIFFRQRFVYFESRLDQTKGVDLQIIYTNTVGYNVVLLGVGVFSVVLICVVARLKRRKASNG